MGKVLQVLYSLWGLTCFSLVFLILFPFYFLIIQKQKWHKYALWLNKIWAKTVYILLFIPVKIIRSEINESPCVYIANHSSYLDIPIVGYSVPEFITFIGMSSLTNIPLFGYMFRKLHIPIDRSKLRSKYKSFEEAKKSIDKGKSVLIFPEGGINVKNIPLTKNFKEGAFRIAIEKQVPIVPITIPYNWIILPGNSNRLKWHKLKIVFHKPIETRGLTFDNIETLKKESKEVIDNEILRHFPYYRRAK